MSQSIVSFPNKISMQIQTSTAGDARIADELDC